MPTSDEPDYGGTKPPLGGSLNGEDQPLAGGSESDSMAEYEDTDPTKFNEDGSFIGERKGGEGGIEREGQREKDGRRERERER